VIAPHDEYRRSRRRRADERVDVADAMTELSIGQLGNVSESGLLLLSHATLRDDALYQLRFTLPDVFGRPVTFDIGAHLLWINPTNAPGQAWMGFRFLSIEDGHLDRLREWIDAPGATYV
jgi:hypothetical protein